MIQIKKTLGIFMAALLVTAGTIGAVPAKAAVTPVISRVGLGHVLLSGQTRTFTATSATYAGQVQYRAFVAFGNHTSWTEITTGYTAATAGKTVFVLPASRAFAVGNYRLSVWVKTAGTNGTIKTALGSYDSYKVSNLTCLKNTVVIPTQTTIFNTTVKASTTGVGSIGNVSLTTVGAAAYPTATQYQIASGTGLLSAISKLGTATTIFPSKVAGDKVTVNLLNVSGVVVKAIDVVLGQPGTVSTVPVVTTTKATVKPSTTGVGSLGTVTSNVTGAVKYQVLNGTDLISATAVLGTTTTIFPSKVVGDKVNVNLIDANGIVIATVAVTLLAY